MKTEENKSLGAPLEMDKSLVENLDPTEESKKTQVEGEGGENSMKNQSVANQSLLNKSLQE